MVIRRKAVAGRKMHAMAALRAFVLAGFAYRLTRVSKYLRHGRLQRSQSGYTLHMDENVVCACEACTCEVPNEGDVCAQSCRECDENAEICHCEHADCAGGETEEELLEGADFEEDEEELEAEPT